MTPNRDIDISLAETAIIVIGRNEGERLGRALRSLPEGAPVIYVDSGSTDDSVDYARRFGVKVVRLTAPPGFSAARARNAGLHALLSESPNLRYVQMLDGDCELDPEWLPYAVAELDQHPELGVVFGRLRERFPGASLYNALCDEEWNGPVGPANACGGIALFRIDALSEAGGYTEDMIAGEEPELCLRLRAACWKVHRVGAEMALHDADMHRFSQWWLRSRRGGHAFAELSWRHGWRGDPHWRRAVASILFWALFLPFMIFVSCVVLATQFTVWAGLAAGCLLALYPIQLGRITARNISNGNRPSFAVRSAAMLLLGKFAQLGGILRFLAMKLAARSPRLIEHKTSP